MPKVCKNKNFELFYKKCSLNNDFKMCISTDESLHEEAL